MPIVLRIAETSFAEPIARHFRALLLVPIAPFREGKEPLRRGGAVPAAQLDQTASSHQIGV
jgi:hypothetical protein